MAGFRPVSRAIAALEAYTLGRRLAEEWRNGRLDAREFRRVREREGVLTMALGVGTAAVTLWHVSRHKSTWPLLVAGALVGSGAVALAAERVGLLGVSREFWPAPPIGTPVAGAAA